MNNISWEINLKNVRIYTFYPHPRANCIKTNYFYDQARNRKGIFYRDGTVEGNFIININMP